MRNGQERRLGEIPSHWSVERLKRLCDVRPSNVDKKIHEKEEVVRLCNYTDVYYNDFISDALDLMSASASPEQIDRLALRADDVIITKDSETSDDIAIAAYVPKNMSGVVCGYHLAIVRPRPKTCGGFIKRYFDSVFAKSCFAVRANGLTRFGLSQYALDNVEVPTPPYGEQIAIATFLDRETAKIDALVEEQRRLKALLKEKRQAFISRAIIKGLNPSVLMKNSGVDWMGDVPAHWTIAPLKRFLSILSGYAFPSTGFSVEPTDTRLLRGVNVGVGRIRWEDVVYWPRVEGDQLERWELRSGDVVLGMDRPWIADGLRVARLSHEDLPCLLLQRVAALRPTDRLLPDYLSYLLQGEAFVHHCVPEMTGVSVPHISPSQIGDFIIALPPPDEQESILMAAEKMLNEAEALAVTAETAIALLQERRTALISGAVTGTIDVRGWSSADVRKAVVAEIIFVNANKPTFGRVKNQKLIYLAEVHAGIQEIGGHYVREAAGPLDRELIADLEKELQLSGFMTVSQSGGPGTTVTYSISPGQRRERDRLEAMLGERLAAFDELNDKLADLDTHAAEAVATLYSVWNDFLLDGVAPTEAQIMTAFLEDWHPEKPKKFKRHELEIWLDWMRRNGLVPQGRGAKTITGRFFA